VVARAVADLAELAELALPLVQVGGVLVAWKREPLDAELAAASESIAMLGGGVPMVESVAVAGLASHRLVIVPKLHATPSRFPRDPAARARDRRREAVPPRTRVRAPAAGLS
jgi:16S rRNA (guanine527-N7)-methyltransferase